LSKILELSFDIENNELVATDGDFVSRFNVFQLREARELFHRYDHANFTHDEDEELDAFHSFCEKFISILLAYFFIDFFIASGNLQGWAVAKTILFPLIFTLSKAPYPIAVCGSKIISNFS